MKLNANYQTVELDGELIVVFAPDDEKSFRGMLKLNSTARLIFDCLSNETDEHGILLKLQEEFDGDEDEMLQDIRMVLDKLRMAGALNE